MHKIFMEKEKSRLGAQCQATIAPSPQTPNETFWKENTR